jgi:hypothetical protein
LADGLDEEMPDLPEEEDVTKVSIVSASSGNTFAEGKVKPSQKVDPVTDTLAMV